MRHSTRPSATLWATCVRSSHDPPTRRNPSDLRPQSTPSHPSSLSKLCAGHPLSTALADIRSWLRRTPARRSVPTDLATLAGTPCRKSSGFPTCETLPAFLPSGSVLAVPVEADRHPPLIRFAAGPTAGPTVPRIRPDSAHPHPHCPGWPLPFPRPSPSSSADTPCLLMNGPSSHPSG